MRVTALLLIGLAISAAVAGAASSRPRADGWTLVDLGLGPSSLATGINEAGQVVGTVVRDGRWRVFLWQQGRITDLGSGSSAFLNQRGQVAINDAGGVRVWDDGRVTRLPSLGPFRTIAVAINDRGDVVGWSATVARVQHAFIWRGGRMIDLGGHGPRASAAVAVNNLGQVVGWRKTRRRGTRRQVRALIWQRGHERDLGVTGGRGGSVPTAINGRGQVVGVSTTSIDPLVEHGFLWTDGALVDLGSSGEYISVRPNALNDQGEVVGEADSKTAREVKLHAFLWEQGRLHDLGTLNRVDWLSSASAIDAGGVIVGTSLTSDVNSATGEDETHAVVWKNGKICELPAPRKAVTTIPTAVNAHHWVVGSTDGRAVLWQPR